MAKKKNERWLYDPETGREVDINKGYSADPTRFPADNRFSGRPGSRPNQQGRGMAQGFFQNLGQMATESGLVQASERRPVTSDFGPMLPPPPSPMAGRQQVMSVPRATGLPPAPAAPPQRTTVPADMTSIQTQPAVTPPPFQGVRSNAFQNAPVTVGQHQVNIRDEAGLPPPPTLEQGARIRQHEEGLMRANINRTNPVVAGNIQDAQDARNRVATSQAVTQGKTLPATQYSPEQLQQLRAAGASVDYSGYRPNVNPIDVGSMAIGGGVGQNTITAEDVNRPLPGLPPGSIRQVDSRTPEEISEGRGIAAAARAENARRNAQRQAEARNFQDNARREYYENRRQAALRGMSVSQYNRMRDRQRQQVEVASAMASGQRGGRQQAQEPMTWNLKGRGKGGEPMNFNDAPPEIQQRVMENAGQWAIDQYKKDNPDGDFFKLDRDEQKRRVRDAITRNSDWLMD